MTAQAAEWTADRIELLRKLDGEGLSASKIAVALNCGATRNAVIGKIHRLGLRKDRPSRAHKPVPVDRPREPAVARRLPIRVAAPKPPAAAAPAPAGPGVVITDLKARMCRWPNGDPTSSAFRFCGAPCERTYCQHHAGIAYRPPERSAA